MNRATLSGFPAATNLRTTGPSGRTGVIPEETVLSIKVGLLCLAKTLSGKELNRNSDVLTVKEPFESLTQLEREI